MRQVLHIFRKDVRRHWLVIAISLVLTAAYGRFEVRTWDTLGAQSMGLAFVFDGRFWAGLAQVLTPVAWCFLVIRVIQDESLVGDRQFWVTRPYEWRKLLGSKAMFTLLFVCAPLLVLQCYLLVSAGFPPAKYVAGLLWMQLLMAIFVLVPAAVLATLTASLAQWLLALLLVALYFVGMNWLSLLQRNSFGVPDVGDHLAGYLFAGICAAVIVLQYARRATVRSRLLVGSFGCVVALAPFISPHDYFLAKAYPALQAGQAPPFQLELLPAENAATEPIGEAEKEVSVRLPLKVTGVPADAIVDMGGVLATIDGPDGQHWDSGWKSIGAQVFPETTEVRVAFAVGRQEFVRMQQAPVTVHLEFAYQQFRDEDQKSFVIPNGRFDLEGMGCSPGSFAQIRCLIPMREPRSLLVTSLLSKVTCPLGRKEERLSDEVGRDWIRRDDNSPADFGISPVTAKALYLLRTDGRGYSGTSACAGTPVTLSHPREIGSSRATIELGGVKVGEYRQASGWR